jgi:membrane protein DedA with SNARE-associated domain
VIQRLLAHLTYAAVLGLLVAGGVGVPVPEELVQLTAGYLARKGVLSLLPAMGVAWLGVVAGDYLVFRMGRRLGPKVLESRPVARLLTPERRALVERHFARHAILTLVAARHASGLRVPVFALAGASGVRSRTFLLADGASALVSVPVVVGLGWLFAARLQELERDLHEVEGVAAALAVAALIAWGASARWRARRAAGREARPPGAEVRAGPADRPHGDGRGPGADPGPGAGGA